MELVYLWVEEYKNIKNQGFNFSPRFVCEFDEDTKELTITENEDYVSIFPDNINVTAIVGKNGSGKSSIFEKLYSSSGLQLSVIFVANQFKIHTSLSNITIRNNTTKIPPVVTKGNFSQVHFSWDILQYEPILNIMDIGYINRNILLRMLETYSHPLYIDLKSYKNNSVIKYIEIFTKAKINIFSFSPNKIEIELFLEKTDNKWDFEKIKEKIEKLNFPKKEAETKKEIYFKTISEYINKYLNDGNKKRSFTLKEYNLLLNQLEHMKEVLLRFPSVNLDMYDNDLSFFDLSHGERSVLLSNALIYESAMNKNEQDILICLDEPDLSLHPEWQKKYINELIKMFSQTTKNFHFLITSHSPFILSDLPKKNVIFLEDGKEVNPDITQTFGANIHTLLSHGFFMDGGLMGEFAKKTIQDVINYLDDKPTQNMNKQKAWQIIQFVGEPFLKHKLEEKYNEKFLTQEEQKLNKIKQLEDE